MARQDCTDLPARSAILIGESSHSIAQEQLDELLKGIGRYYRSVPGYFDVLSDERSELDDAGMKHGNHIIGNTGFGERTCKETAIGQKGDANGSRLGG